MRYLFIFLFLFVSKISLAELIKPNSNLLPKEVISIQLTALQKNNLPYDNAGIEQTWEFAHPSNRKFTGPLINFIKMMYSKSYSIMLNHKQHKIIPVENKIHVSYFFIELIDENDNKFGFQWTVERILVEGEFKDCWMTSGVSQPMLLAKSA